MKLHLINVVTDGRLDIRTDDEITSKNHTPYKHYPDKTLYTRIDGELCAFNTTQIIKRYKPKAWIMENPQSSRIWDYLEIYHNFSGYRNIAHYGAYNASFPKKPTCFLSNYELDLKKMGKGQRAKVAFKKSEGQREVSRNYNVRSDIPDELIVDALNQLIKKIS